MRSRALLRFAVLALSLAFAASPVHAADKDDVMNVVQRFVGAFNAGDVKLALDMSLDDMSIIDEFPPYEWHGPGTMTTWLNDYGADAKKNGISEGKVTIAKTKHVFVDGDRAYVVTASDYEYKKAGKPVKQKGSAFTFALKKIDAAWKISGWSWSTN
jgi:ketosteroid isomerase-like protein